LPSLFFAAAPAGLAVMDEHLRFVHINDALAKINGLPTEQHVGKTLQEVLPHLAPALEPVLHKVLTTREPIQKFEVVGETPAHPGLTRHRVATYFPIIDTTDTIRGVGALVVETTAPRQADETIIPQTQLLDLAQEAIFVRDLDDAITFWNRGAAEMYGWSSDEALGRNTYDLLQTRFPKPLSEIELEVVRCGHWEGEVVHTRRNGAPVAVFSRWALQRNEEGAPVAFLVSNTDVTDRQQAVEALRRLSVELLRSQDEDRRRIAQNLHDVTGQKLAAMAMHLATVHQCAGTLDAEGRKALDESLGLLDRIVQEIRTLSYLLYPPLLDEHGLTSALRWYVEGFTERSGIQVTLDVPPDQPRLPREVETVVFRVMQEALTNVHRHSGSPTAAIRLAVDPTSVCLEVRDNGQGFPHHGADDGPPNPGVGIMSMRERVKQLGGEINIESGAGGTAVHGAPS
jgi:PAS domain S-box-containing protein